MEPTHPTSESLDNLARYGHPELREHLRRSAEQVGRIVPSVVALSISKLVDGVMVTLAASSPVAPTLDAVQYLDGGPCLQAVEDHGVIVADEDDPLNEERWSLFARTSAAEGIQSSLSLPLVDAAEVVGGVNIYASDVGAFNGLADDIAAVFDAWAPGAVHDADLGFAGRRAAADTAALLAQREQTIERAAAIIAQIKHVGPETAHHMLAESARRAGISIAEIARTIVRLHD